MTTARSTIQIAMKADLIRSDLREGLIWFVNYAALDPTAIKVEDLDLHGAGMLPQDVEKFAHRWLAFSRSIDIEHDGIGRPINVIESFYNSPDVGAAAWPINSHAVRFDVSQSDEALKGLRDGSLNSVSLDAFTFNKIVRLPAAQAKSMVGSPDPFVPPTTVQKWAEELAQDGYPGITGVHQVGPDMYVAQRDSGLPVAITVKDGCLEASTASGPWAHIGLALCETPSLTNKAIGIEGNTTVLPGAGGEKTTPWSADLVNQLMSEWRAMPLEAQTAALSNLKAQLHIDTPPDESQFSGLQPVLPTATEIQ